MIDWAQLEAKEMAVPRGGDDREVASGLVGVSTADRDTRVFSEVIHR